MPLSPYLIFVAINELSIKLQEAMQNNDLSDISLGREIHLSTLFFLQMISFYVAKPL
jgi:hypothetical protein